MLGAIMQVDDRITVDQFRVAAWVEILDSDITYDFAIEEVKSHYGQDTVMMMPAHINKAWRGLRKKERERETMRVLTASVKVDRSPEVELEIQELKRKLSRLGTVPQTYTPQGQNYGGITGTAPSGVFASTW